MSVAPGGLATYIVYQWCVFGEPLAFAKAQANWDMRIGGDAHTSRAIVGMLTLELIATSIPRKWSLFWLAMKTDGNPPLSLQFANPLFFVATIAPVIVGWRKKWLTFNYQLLLSAGLLFHSLRDQATR